MTYLDTDEMPPVPSVSDKAAVNARFLADLADLSPALVAPGRRLWERIVTPNWVLEWGLPLWLSETFGLSAGVTRELLVSNVYMLAYARHADDLVDGDEPSQSSAFGVALHHLWIMQCVRLFDSTAPLASARPLSGLQGGAASHRFFACFDTHMKEWLLATLGGAEGDLTAAPAESSVFSLARRGAPLKIVCAAAGLLADRDGDIPLLNSAIDQVMIGVVLLDEYFDWEQDLQASRHNAFVAFCSELPQTAGHRNANRRALLRTIYLHDGAKRYFETIDEYLRQADEAACAARCPGLQHFVSWYGREVAACSAALRQTAAADLTAFFESRRTVPGLVLDQR